jgi:hypothetical protein
MYSPNGWRDFGFVRAWREVDILAHSQFGRYGIASISRR